MTQDRSFVWDVYERTQTRADRSTLDHAQWAADETADAILDVIASEATPKSREAFERQVANLLVNRGTKHRRRVAIKASRYDPLHRDRQQASHFDQVAAIIQLDDVRKRLRACEWHLLESVGAGTDYASIAAAATTTVTAIKKRVARARLRLAA